jgi:hypothetical protein
MKKRFYLTLLVLAVILLALPGLTANGVRRVTRHPRRFARRLPRVHPIETDEPAELVAGTILRKGQPCVAKNP